MRALARSHQQPASENKTCRLFGAARGDHSMRAGIAVNLPMGPESPVIGGRTEGVDALRLTLARESRHIVAFGLSGTTSRAAVLTLTRPWVLRTRPGALSAPGEG